VARCPGWLRRGVEGEKASLGHEEAVSRQTEGGVVIEAAPAAALELGQTDLLLEVAIILLDPVAALGVSAGSVLSPQFRSLAASAS
jgi:hypothetical protein